MGRRILIVKCCVDKTSTFSVIILPELVGA